MNNQLKLFKENHLPVFRQDGSSNWQKINIPIQQNGFVKVQEGFQLTFRHLFTKKVKHFFAFSYPWTSEDCDNLINNLITANSDRVFAKYQNFALTLGKRNVKILTLTKLKKNCKWKESETTESDECQMKPILFQGKKGIFISARVHPGEVASSFILNGILEKILAHSAESNLLLQNFVFYIVPMINPDGVDEGNFRTDSKGKNLNRCYIDPKKFQQPEIYAIKKFLIKMIHQNKIEFCLDLHAHVNKQGAFIYGNFVQDLKSQVEVCLFPKILAFNCPYFDYDACNFSEKNMSSKDKADDLSKQGASRVAIFKQTGLKACWTLQCNYNSCKSIGQLKSLEVQSLKTVSAGILALKQIPTRKQQKTMMGINQFKEIGSAVCESILDFYRLRLKARYYTGNIKNRSNFLINLAIQILRMIPFRFDNSYRKILTNINSGMSLNQNINKLQLILQNFEPGINLNVAPLYASPNNNKINNIINSKKMPSGHEFKKTKENLNRHYSVAHKKESLSKPTLKLSKKQINLVKISAQSQGHIGNHQISFLCNIKPKPILDKKI